MEERFDVIIVGSGPAGMSAALEIIKMKPTAKIAIFEQGKIRLTSDRGKPKYSTRGWGGAGTFSDGKLNLTWESGGQLIDVISEEKFEELMHDVDEQYLKFGGDQGTLKIPDEKMAKALKIEALSAGFKDFIYFPTRHWGTDSAYFIVEKIRQYLVSWTLKYISKRKLSTSRKSDVRVFADFFEKRVFKSGIAIMAVGRGGNEQTSDIAKNFGLKITDNGVDIGVRLETLAETLEKFTDVVQSPKLVYNSKRNGKEVRTFCVCPRGFVRLEA